MYLTNLFSVSPATDERHKIAEEISFNHSSIWVNEIEVPLLSDATLEWLQINGFQVEENPVRETNIIIW